jgi:hypothetical protein
MRDTLTFFAAMFTLTVLLEIFALMRWHGRRSVLFCVISVAVFSGVLWLTSAMTLFHIRWGWKAASESPLSSSDWLMLGFFVLLDVLLFSLVALIPAGSVAFIYRRFRSQI